MTTNGTNGFDFADKGDHPPRQSQENPPGNFQELPLDGGQIRKSSSNDGVSNNVEFNTNTNAHESWADYPESDQMDTDSSEYYTEDENEEGKIPKGPYHQFQNANKFTYFTPETATTLVAPNNNTQNTTTEQDNMSKTYASVAATFKTNLAKSQDKQEELRMSNFKVPQKAFDDLKRHNDAVFPEEVMTSDLSTIINKYGHEKVFDTIENTLITTAQNLEGYLSEYPENVMRKAFKYFTLKLSIEDKQTRDVCEEILGMREELMYIQRILDFNIMDKVMCFMPFTFEQMEGKLSSEKAKVRTIVENLELDFDGTVEHIKIDSAKRKRQLVAFKVPIHCRSLAERYFRQIFLHKEDVIVQQYAPIIEKVQLGRKGKTEENNHQLLTEYVCYFIVDLFSGQVPKRRIKIDNTKNKPSSYEQCTSRVLSNCKYCEYCRSMTHTKYHCPLIKPCTNCGVKGHKTTSCKKALSTNTLVLKRPETKPNFPILPPKVVNKTTSDDSQRKGSIAKTTSHTKGDNTEKMVTPSAQNENSTLQESIPVTITGHREAPTTPPVADTTAKKTMTTGVLEMDTSKHTISSNDEASPRKKLNLKEKSSNPMKNPMLYLSPNLQ